VKFTLDSFRSVLDEALSHGYRFGDFTEEPVPPHGVLYLRHDVDYSLSMAVALARVNAERGVRGTFLLLLRSQVYNLLSANSLQRARELMALGQTVGLHVPAPPPEAAADAPLDRLVRRDFDVVSQELPELAPVFAWHNPNREILQRSASLPSVGGLVNAYHERWTGAIAYRSDSNLRNRPDELISFIRNHERRSFQLLIHPLNWVGGGDDMKEIFAATWKQIVRDREEEVRINQWYASTFPRGMPAALLDSFADGFIDAAGGSATLRLDHEVS
jgi:hypothetical protein